MKMTALRATGIAVLLMSTSLAMKQEPASILQSENTPAPGLATRITMLDGTVQIARLEGFGCSRSICSRVVIKGRPLGRGPASFALDHLSVIKIAGKNRALLVLDDGSEETLSLLNDFRVLYLDDPSSSRRLDLSAVRSIEFLAR